ncbi:hypothetical protein [Mycobacterium asiaticum]|uniref:hypothetical protein n=1 Tax=Mycobacterium asiaticum TaxID=1790 RepID=UPI0012DB4C72|nr:hypothetical protein [Mycobacterium asiaticum]
MVALICGAIAAGIAVRKNRSAVGWFLIGALLSLVGIVIIAMLPAATPGAAHGTRKVYCGRCTAAQDIPIEDSSFVCWQCKRDNKVPSLPPATPER